MDSTEIGKVCAMFDAAWPDKTSGSMPPEQSLLRAQWETAYQLALLNEGMNWITDSQTPRMHVMVEPGNWPIQVQTQNNR